MPKHSITPAYDNALQQFAERLPVPEVEYRKPVTGAELLRDSPDIKGPKGEPIDPKKQYFVGSTTSATNHLRQLRKAFHRGGQQAVVDYLAPYAEFLKEE